MGYGRTVPIDDPVAEAVARVKEALKAQGFGRFTGFPAEVLPSCT